MTSGCAASLPFIWQGLLVAMKPSIHHRCAIEHVRRHLISGSWATGDASTAHAIAAEEPELSSTLTTHKA